MSQLTINIGSAPNDTAGDPLRIAFNKVNSNFTELYGNLQNVIPTVTGNNGKILSTNGSTLQWVAPVTDISQLTDTTHLLESTSAVVPISANPPSNPVAGNLWYSTTAGRMYIYYEGAWIDANPI